MDSNHKQSGHDAGLDPDALPDTQTAQDYDAASITEQARHLMAQFARISTTGYDWMPAHTSAFRHLDLAWYDSTRKLLERCGFRQVGDVQLVRTQQPGGTVLPSFARKSVSGDGLTQSDIFHVQKSMRARISHFFRHWSLDQGVRALVFNTEFTDGTFFSTSNTPQQFETEPGLYTQSLPADVLLPAALKKHLEGVRQHLSTRQGVKVVPVRTLDEQIASENRAQALRAQTRLNRTLSAEELVRLGAEPALAELLAAEMLRLKAGVDEVARLSPDADAFLQTALQEFNEKQAALNAEWSFDSYARWSFNAVQGVLKLEYDDGRALLADGQVLGTFSLTDHNFEWAWHNPHVEEALKRDSRLARDLGQRLNISYLTSGMVPVPNQQVLSYIGAIGLKASGAVGLFRASEGDVHPLVLVSKLRWADADPGVQQIIAMNPRGEGEKPPLLMDALIQEGLRQGIAQVQAVGSPLNAFLLTDRGELGMLFDPEGGDPMDLALKAIRQQFPQVQRCVLVLDTRVTFKDSGKFDAIVVMACERDVPEGQVWAQRYAPAKLLRAFRTVGEPEQIAAARNFIVEALAED